MERLDRTPTFRQDVGGAERRLVGDFEQGQPLVLIYQHMPREQSLRRGALLMVASALLFAGMGLGVKIASASLPNTMVVFFRSAVGLAVLLPLLPRLGRRGLATRHLGEHLVRSLAGLAAMYCFFFAIARMRLADAVLLNYSLPLFMPVIARVWLREAIPPRLWRSLALGFMGVALILKPGLSLFNSVALVGLAAAVLAALAQVGVRRLTETEPVTRIVFYFGLISTFVSAVPLVRSWRTPAPALWGTLLAVGVFATIAQLFMTRAYAHAPAAQVGPFIYAAVPFAAAFDALLFGLWPDALSVAGAVLVCAAGISTLRRMSTSPEP
jgi:drug/metabolite transporter (DMT)-like permease